MKLAASMLFLALAAGAQTTATQSGNPSASPQSEPSSDKSPAYPVQQGNGKPADSSQPEKGYKPKKHRRAKSAGTAADTTASDTNSATSKRHEKGTTSEASQPNSPETTHQSNPPPQNSKPDSTSPSPQ